MPEIIKFPNLTKSILESLELPEEYRIPTKDKGEYIIFVNIDEWEAARILVNEKNHDIQVSFNYDTDPALVAYIALIMGGYAQMEIYESYRICDEGNIFWWDENENDWIPDNIDECNCNSSNSTIH